MNTTKNIPDDRSLSSDPIVTIGGDCIYLDDLLWEYKTSGFFEPGPLRELLKTQLAVREAARLKIHVAPDELEQASGRFFAHRDLMEPEQIEQWLEPCRLTREQVERQLERTLLRKKVEEAAASDEAAANWYREHPYDYQEATLDVLYYESEGVAAEMLLAVREGEQAWADAAARASAAQTLRLSRKDAPEQLAAVLFSAAPGELRGPHETEGRHALYRLTAIHGAELDGQLIARIRRDMLDELYNRLLDRLSVSYEK